MHRRILCLASFVPLMSSCPDRRFTPFEYAITQDDRVAIQRGIGGYFDKTTNVEITTAKASRVPDFAPLQITVCGSFVLSNVNTRATNGQPHRFAGVLSDTKDGTRVFDVSSFDKIDARDADTGASRREAAQGLSAILCP